ncbi:hypothetical protein LAZ67_8002131 [Cordylochernes scorpioides]|uniref:ATP-dependent DNA helicase n=1 Tax=Cordylochernes scorpioides TaxID=51811 RepID=A0ABY6KQS0_9ARAC|nr:hypothetical protein LAZ67_8002131 [Cordylochernes scorpioides]
MPRKRSAIGVRTPAACRMAARAARGQSSRTLENSQQSQARLQRKVRICDLPEPPEALRTLLDGSSPHSAEFMQRVCHYNNAFQMTSFGCGSRVVLPGYMPTFKVQSQVYHRIGSVLPPLNSDSRQLQPAFLQVFFIGDSSAEVATHHRNFPITKPHIASILQDMLHRHNPYVHLFKASIEKMPSPDYKLVIKADKAPPGHHPRTFNAPTINEVAIVIVQENCNRRDIVLSKRGSDVQRINQFHRSYDALQYPLVFWNGQDGYQFHIPQLIDRFLRRTRRRNPGITNWSLAFGDLTHQILVDIYAKVESERLHYISAHQGQLRATEYINLLDAIRTDRSHALIGRQVILPSSFVGSARHMHEYAQDCMAYVHKYGRPDLFITFTCNPEWPEIKLMQFPTQGAFVWHDLFARIFQLKVTKLIDLITKGDVFGKPQFTGAQTESNEVLEYQHGRNISSNEAVWHILGFPIHRCHPMVQHLSVHLENGQRVYFTSVNAALQAHRPPKTMLTEFFALCLRDNFAKTLLNVEVPVYYIWSASKSWQPRKQGTRIADQAAFASDAIGRVYTVHPNYEECFYLRMLLHSVRGPTSFAALRTINGVLCQTYKEACLHLVLLENGQQWHHCIQEAVLSESPLKIRELFAIILTCSHPTNPQDIWAQFKEPMSADILNLARQQANDGLLQLTYEMSNRALILLEQKVLQMTGFHLTKFGMRYPQRNVTHRTSHELLRETSYDLSMLLQFAASNEPKLANVPEQKEAYERILSKINSNAGGLYFLDAPGGTGKTFLINLLLTKVRSTGDIALSTASFGIAATLLHGGRTAHSTFKLPLDLTRDEVPVCNLNADSPMGEDQTPMGGVVLLLAGDFRQILPIIPRGTIADELHACLKASPLWSFVERLTLSTNMRAVNSGDPNSMLFSQFLLQLGSGQLNDTDEATTLTGCFQNEEVFIPRIPLIHDDKHSPLHFKRLQFPIQVSFAMSINKAQVLKDIGSAKEKIARTKISLEKKLSIIKAIESGTSQAELRKKMKMSKSSISTIWGKREDYKKRMLQKGINPNYCRYRQCHYPLLEEALYTWLVQARLKNIPLNGLILQQKAIYYAMGMKYDEFEASNGWLDRFKARRNIIFRKICGEERAVNPLVVEDWKEKISSFLDKYSPSNIYNIDESGLFYKCLPDKTLTFKGDTCSGTKWSKERITFLAGTNMDGSDKLPLLVIGKYAKPRCFRKEKNLSTHYEANKTAWMTAVIFKKYLHYLDEYFGSENKKVLLILDNCPAHHLPEKLENIQVFAEMTDEEIIKMVTNVPDIDLPEEEEEEEMPSSSQVLHL